MKPLTARQEAFLRALATGIGPSKAYRAAYTISPRMKPQSIGSAAGRLMRLPHVAPHVAAIRLHAVETVEADIVGGAQQRAARHNALLEELDISRERVLRELARVAFADIGKLATWDAEVAQIRSSLDLTEAERAAVAEIVPTPRGLRLKLHDKLAALATLGRMLGLFEPEKRAPDSTLHLNINIVPPEPEEGSIAPNATT